MLKWLNKEDNMNGIWSEFAEEELENNMPDEEDEDADS